MLDTYKAKDDNERLLNRYSNAQALLSCSGLNEDDKKTLGKLRNDLKAEILEIMRGAR